MINLMLERYAYGDDSTLGKLWHVTDTGRDLQCFTLEDEERDEKVPGETAIPIGTYEIKLRTEGGMHEKYLRKFMELLGISEHRCISRRVSYDSWAVVRW